ncbi:APMAP [Mytilus coruscus]|uniref:APMAP n=1 Tax=Mytilus coruscus TaxID=42192 RepID=A0A6J8B075_MYTCO|nr:APMAP [Mytilus coruscus]
MEDRAEDLLVHLQEWFNECASPVLNEYELFIKDKQDSDILNDIENEFTIDERDEIFFSKFDGNQYVKDKTIFNASNNGRLLTIETLTENVKQLIEEATSKDVASSIHQRSFKMLVNKRIRHSFNEGAFDGKVISTVPGFPDYYSINDESNVTDSTAIYTYRLLEDYRVGKLEIIPEVVGMKPCSEFCSRLRSLAHAAQIASHCFTFSFSDK